MEGLNSAEVEKRMKQADSVLISKPSKTSFTADDQILQQIKAKLNPRPRKTNQKQYFIPEQIDLLIPKLKSALLRWDLQIESIQPIHYGRQLKITGGALWAEINVFYGKRGYSIVSTTKTGSNQELAVLAKEAIWQTIEGSSHP